MTLGQGHVTPLGHGQQLCEILYHPSSFCTIFQDGSINEVCPVLLLLLLGKFSNV